MSYRNPPRPPVRARDLTAMQRFVDSDLTWVGPVLYQATVSAA